MVELFKIVANYRDLTDTRDLGWHLFTGVQGQLIGSVFKDKTILEEYLLRAFVKFVGEQSGDKDFWGNKKTQRGNEDARKNWEN